jgi:GxxExxY protein
MVSQPEQDPEEICALCAELYRPSGAAKPKEIRGEKPPQSWLNRCTMKTTAERNRITGQIIDAAMHVHTKLGPGLLESAYEACLAYELRKRGFKALTQVGLPVIYDEVQLDVGYRIDLLVEDEVIVELKAVDEIAPIHEAQLLSYLKLSGRKVGLLINFNVRRLKDGIHRRVN